MVEQDQFLARPRILQADAARKAAVGVGGHPARAQRRKLCIAHREQRRKGFGVEAGNGIGHWIVLPHLASRLPCRADPRVPMLAFKASASNLRRHDPPDRAPARSEEHTSELQSLMRISYAVFCLKKNK